MTIKYEQLETVWHINEHASQLLSLVVNSDPAVRPLAESMQQRCPVAETCRPFEEGAFHRMKGHARSFATRTDHGVVVFKGTEPMSKDYLEILEEAEQTRSFAFLSKVDWYVLIENEPFLGQALNLALNYAVISLEFTTKYYERFGKLPRIPFPISVHKLPQPVADEFGAKCAPYVSDRPQISARDRLGRLIQRGLGVFVYYYPGSPVRAAHARGMFPGSHEPGWFQSSQDVDFKTAIDGWLELTAEMLVLNYFPTAHIHQGNCMQSQNLVVDGGMCDIDSLHPMSKAKTDREFLDALFYSLFQLTQSITSVLTDHAVHTPQLVWGMVWGELIERVRRKAKPGETDPRLLDMLKPVDLAYLFDARMMDAMLTMRTTPVGVL
jgi:hypothetical protein